jgi:hypothetical protein
MAYKLNLIDKQGNRLTASVKAETLEEAHQKAKSRGYLIDNEKEKESDLIETIVINKEELGKARKNAKTKNESQNNKTDNAEIEDSASEKDTTRKSSRGDRSIIDSNDNGRPNKSNNRRKPGYKSNKPKIKSNNFFVWLALLPIIYIVVWFTFPYHLLILSIQFPILIFIGPILIIVGLIFSILLLLRNIKSKKTSLIIFGSIVTILNLVFLGIIIYGMYTRK